MQIVKINGDLSLIIREVSFFTRRGGGGLLKIGEIRYFVQDQKGGSKDFFKLKRGITYIF